VTRLDERVAAALIGLLNDESLDIAGRAAARLGQIGDPSAGEALEAALRRSGDKSFRTAVVEALVRTRGRRAVPVLIPLLADNDPDTRNCVLRALSRLYAPESVEALIPLLRSKGNYDRLTACLMLAGYGEAKTVPALCDVLAGDDGMTVRMAAAFALGQIGDASAIDALVEFINNNDLKPPASAANERSMNGEPNGEQRWALCIGDAKAQAVEAIRAIGGPKAGGAIFAALAHADGRVRGAALLALAESGDTRAPDRVLKALSDPDLLVAAAAVTACELYDDPRLVKPLIALAKNNGNKQVSKGYYDFGEHGSQRQVISTASLRDSAMEVLYRKWPADARAALFARLKASNIFWWGRAIEMLAGYGDKRAFDPLVRAVRMNSGAAEGLALLGDRRAIPVLQLVAERCSSDIYVVEAMDVAKALFKLEPKAAVPQLVKIVRTWRMCYTPSPATEAVDLLAEVGNDEAVACIRWALRGYDFPLRQAARKALTRLGKL